MSSKKAANYVGGAAKDAAIETVKDFDPKEILNSGIFSLQGDDGSLKDIASGGFADFGQKFLEALIPDPEMLGGMLAKGFADKECLGDLTNEALDSGIMDQIQSAKARGRRASSTAKKCVNPSCNTFHFRMDGFCAEHKNQGKESTSGKSTVASLKADAALDPTSELAYHLKAVELRERMIAQAETYNVETTIDLVPEAKALLKGIKPSVDDTELGQMLYQFRRLDVDCDGVFTVADFTTWIHRVDPDFKLTEATVEDWLSSCTTDSKPQFDFVGYYQMVLARRAWEKNNWGQAAGVIVPAEIKQTPFWDLRLIALHGQTKSRHGWMLKRGYLFTKESLNSWKLRYVRTHAVRPWEPPLLEYWDADPNVQVEEPVEGQPAQVFPVRKGTINIADIIFVDFSPKTSSPRGSDPKLREEQLAVGLTEPEKEVVLKITLNNGRRFTFAVEEDDAVSWASDLSRYAAASRLMVDWRENWGTKRIGKVVLRDWLNAAVVVAKIGMQKNAHVEAKKIIAAAATKWTILPGGKAAALKKAQIDATNYIKDLVLNERDIMMLRVVGLDDKTVDQLGGLALRGVQLWNVSKGHIKYYDDQYLFGIAQKTASGVATAVNVYNYAAATKNAYNSAKWKVEWEPKSMQRACNVCHQTFKTMTLRKTMGKHHCRSCGKVVCHVCAANRIYMPLSKRFERVCISCITEKGTGAGENGEAAPVPITGADDADDSSDDSGGEN